MNDTDLKQAWRERSDHKGYARPACVEADRIWQAVSLELPSQTRREIADHAAGCAECAQTWRLTSEFSRQSTVEKPRSRHLWVAAAILLATIGVSIWSVTVPRPLSLPSGASDWRDSVPFQIESRLEEDEALPAADFVLRWSPGPEGTLYEVEVGTPDLRILDRAVALESSEYKVKPERLADLASGDRVAWRVEAILPDGERRLSLTFFNTIR